MSVGDRPLLVGLSGTALLVGAVVAVGVFAGPALAGDQPTVIYPGADAYTVEQGESVAIDVRVTSDGGIGDVGVESMTVRTSYNETILTATGVEAASWLDGDEPTTVETETEIDDGNGQVTVEQWRDPPAGGTTGDELYATVTFDVAEDAPTTNTTVAFDDSEVLLSDEFPAPVHSEEATVTVEQGDTGNVSQALAGAALVLVGVVLVVGAVVVRRQ